VPETRSAHLVLPAAGEAPAKLEVEPQPAGKRKTRAVLIMVAAVVVSPAVLLVPPHIIWPIIALGAGIYFARRTWKGEYVVTSFEGNCPRCGEPLELDEGTRIQSREILECFNCHREPELVVEDDGSGGESDEAA
jgi:hypothetical protein